MSKKTYAYKSFDQDVITSADQDYHLPADYRWIRRGSGARLKYAATYCVVRLVTTVYMRLVRFARYEGLGKVREVPRGQGIFLYGNHTMPFGDVVSPAIVAGRHRVRTVVSNANYGIPVIGKILPWVGALPLGETASDAKSLSDAIYERLGEGNAINIFPEAHVWPYYTDIRPFGTAAFHYQATSGAPAFTHTAVYTRPKFGHRPRLKIVVDGPFFPDMSLPLKARMTDLRDRVAEAMRTAAQRSDYEYCEYLKIEGDE